jgi:hypothetical protein
MYFRHRNPLVNQVLGWIAPLASLAPELEARS